MSETQTDYDTDAEPTPGPVAKGVTSSDRRRIAKVLKGTDMVGEHNTHCDIHSKSAHIQGQEPVANADLIAGAFNAAQEAREMGYDPVAAVEALPEGLDAARRAIIDLQEAHTSGPPEDSAEAAAQAASHRLKVFMAEAGADETMIPGEASVALASAEGIGQ